MNGASGMPDGAGFPDGFAGFTDANSALLSSSSNLNNSNVVLGANEPSVFAPETGVAGAEVPEPPAKRMKIEPNTQPMAAIGSSATVANMAAIAANRATAAAVGSGLSTEQFLQSLPSGSATKTPAYMVMMQQQQNARQQQLQHQHQQQQLQVQRHMQMQRQMQLQHQQQLQGATMQYVTPQPQQQNMHPSAHAQAQAIMMAAMAQNRIAGMAQQQQQHQQQQQPYLATVKTETGATSAQPLGQSTQKPHPTEDPVCLICRDKSGDLFQCSYSCGLAVHPRCLGEDKIFTTALGAKACGSCFLTHQDRNTKENLQTGGAIGISVRRAILSLNVETNKDENFEKFGHLASLRLHEIAQIAGYPISPFAYRFAEPYLQRWVSAKLSRIASSHMSVRDAFTVMIGLYSLDRVGVAHSWRNKVIDMVRAKNYQTTDFLGWHPAIEGPNLLNCSRCRRALMFPTIFTKFVSALLASYYAESVGIGFGTTFLDVFAHTHSVRSHYKGLKPFDAEGYEWDMFADQLRTIFGLLDIVSDFGVLELNADLFEAEVQIIFNPQYLNQAMMTMEFEVVAKFLQCMKLFGKQRADQYRATIEICERFLLTRQATNGSFCRPGASVIDQYKATVACAKALLNPVFRGRGPINGDVHRLLVKWAKKTPGNLHAKRAEQLGNGKQLIAGVTMNGRTGPNLKKLDVYYRRQIVPTSGLNPLETLAAARLRAIWTPEKSEPQNDAAKDELTAAVTDNEDTDSIIVKTEQSESADQKDDAAPSKNDGETGATSANESASAIAREQDEDDSLINLSLSGELSLFDGLKFEDGDVIDISGNGSGDAAGGVVGEDDEELGDDVNNDNGRGAQREEDDDDDDDDNVNAPSDEQDDDDDDDEIDGKDDAAADDAEGDVYDDDDDADESSQLPEPDAGNAADSADTEEANEAELVDGLDVDMALDEFGQGSMDLGMDM